MSDLPPDPIGQVADEFLQQLRAGGTPLLPDYCQRYPALASRIRELFPTLIEIERLADESKRVGIDGPKAPSYANGCGLVSQIGDFRIVREISRGGMGVVYEAFQQSLGRQVALKVLPRLQMENDVARERFRREAQASARLHHTNIVPVFGVGEDHDLQYYAMQFISGRGLDEVLREIRAIRDGVSAGSAEDDGHVISALDLARMLIWGQGSQAAQSQLDHGKEATGFGLHREYYRRVARIVLQAAEALDYAHEQGVIHRDVKPSNLMLDAQGIAWLTDFGLARHAEHSAITRTGDLAGTLRYLAPERLQGNSDSRCDIYSLGMTLYELLTLQPAFCESDRSRLIGQISHAEPARPRRLDPRIPFDLETITLTAIAKNPTSRYQNAGELADDLRRYLELRPVRARRAGLPKRGWWWCRRNPVVAGLTAALLVAVASGFCGVAWKWRDAELARRNEHTAREDADRRAIQARRGHEQLMRATDLVDIGIALSEARGWDDADAAFSQAIKLRPQLFWSWEKRGDMYLSLGLFDLAASDYERAFALRKPVDRRHWFRLALLRLHIGDLSGYRAVLKDMAAELHGSVHLGAAIDLLRAHALLDDSYLATSPWRALLENVDNVREVDEHPWCLYVLGVAHYRTGAYQQAIDRLKEAIPRWPSGTIGYPMLAMAYHRLGNPQDSRQTFWKASQAREEWLETLFAGESHDWSITQGALTDWPLDQLDWLEFEHYYREASELLGITPPAEDGRLRVLRGRALAALRRRPEADQEYRAALQLRPADPQIRLETHRNRGYLMAKLGDYDEALMEFREALQFAPDDVALWSFVAVCELAAGDQAAFRETCRGMVQRFSASSDDWVLHTLMWTLSLDATAEMPASILVACQASQYSIDASHVLVGAHYRAGQFADAVRVFQHAAKVSRLRPSILFFSAMAHHQLGDSQTAHRHLAEAIQIMDAPEAPSARQLALGLDPRSLTEKIAERLLRQEAESLILGR